MHARSRALVAAVLVAVLALTVGTAANARNTKQDSGKQLTGYFIQWGVYSGFEVKNVDTSGDASKLTQLNYAFSNAAPDSSGNVVCQSGDPWADWQRPVGAASSVDGNDSSGPVQGNLGQLRLLKAAHPQLRVLMSIGGWTWSKYFSDAALTPQSRETFVKSCIDLWIKGNLPGAPAGAAAGIVDGFDLDWEWPGSDGNTGNIIRPQDKQDFTELVKEFRKQLDKLGHTQTKRDYLLTAFLPAAASKIDAGFEVKKIFKDLDYGNLQGYDLHGPWEPTTNHQANLFENPADPTPQPHFSVDTTVRAYLSRGAPAEKITIGVPFYSHGWSGVPPANNGLFQPGTGTGDLLYKNAASLLGSGYTRYWDPVGQDAWLYNGSTFYTFDDPAVMSLKAQYVQRMHLGGAMFWELSGDTSDGQLVSALSAGLG
jgi:chitinase